MFKIFSVILFIFSQSVCSAGYVVNDGIITEVANVADNIDQFALRVSGGTGICSDGTTIKFPASYAATPESYQRAYATALMALSTGMRVDIYNYEDSSCDRASFSKKMIDKRKRINFLCLTY